MSNLQDIRYPTGGPEASYWNQRIDFRNFETFESPKPQTEHTWQSSEQLLVPKSPQTPLHNRDTPEATEITAFQESEESSGSQIPLVPVTDGSNSRSGVPNISPNTQRETRRCSKCGGDHATTSVLSSGRPKRRKLQAKLASRIREMARRLSARLAFINPFRRNTVRRRRGPRLKRLARLGRWKRRKYTSPSRGTLGWTDHSSESVRFRRSCDPNDAALPCVVISPWERATRRFVAQTELTCRSWRQLEEQYEIQWAWEDPKERWWEATPYGDELEAEAREGESTVWFPSYLDMMGTAEYARYFKALSPSRQTVPLVSLEEEGEVKVIYLGIRVLDWLFSTGQRLSPEVMEGWRYMQQHTDWPTDGTEGFKRGARMPPDPAIFGDLRHTHWGRADPPAGSEDQLYSASPGRPPSPIPEPSPKTPPPPPSPLSASARPMLLPRPYDSPSFDGPVEDPDVWAPEPVIRRLGPAYSRSASPKSWGFEEGCPIMATSGGYLLPCNPGGSVCGGRTRPEHQPEYAEGAECECLQHAGGEGHLGSGSMRSSISWEMVAVDRGSSNVEDMDVHDEGIGSGYAVPNTPRGSNEGAWLAGTESLCSIGSPPRDPVETPDTLTWVPEFPARVSRMFWGLFGSNEESVSDVLKRVS